MPASPHPAISSPNRPKTSLGAAASFTVPTSPNGGFSLLAPRQTDPETFLSRFTLGGHLGQGSYGIVHAAVDKATGEEVAVKVVSKQANGGRNQRSALHREATLWRKACQASRQACKFVEIAEDASHYYIVQERCHGGSLQDMLESRGSLSEAEVTQVAWCVLSFLSDLHKHSIYYGDLKPGNVILKDQYPCSNSPDGCLSVRVVDFGCAQLVTPSQPLRAMSGSPLFLAPEIITGSYGLPADMWALGVMLFTLISNRLPFWLEPVAQLEAMDMDDIAAAIRYQPVLFAGKQWKGVSEELKDLVCRLLEKDPARRLTGQQAAEHPWFAAARETCSYQ